MISQLNIKSLFGLYDYEISFECNPLIITGPNGYGKTTILTIIKNLYEKNFWYFYYLPFESIEVVIDNQEMKIRRITNSDESDIENVQVVFYFANKEKLSIGIDYINRLRPIRNLKFHGRTYSQNMSNMSEDEVLSNDYVFETDEYLNAKGRELIMFFDEDNKKVNFVGANRIYDNALLNSTEKVSYTIDRISKEIGNEYEKQQNIFAEKSRQIDAGFINRLISTSSNSSYKLCENEIKELKNLIKEYQKYNIVAQEFGIEDFEHISKKYEEAVALYISDMRLKMEIFRSFYNKLDMLYKFVSEKELSDKQVVFSKYGLTFKNKKGIDLYNLHKLSSGEQNLFILYYNMIFKSNKHTVLLIDEPENSMHIEWISSMLKDYKEITDKIGCQIIVATHSPAFINGEWNLTYDLFEHTNFNKEDAK